MAAFLWPVTTPRITQGFKGDAHRGIDLGEVDGEKMYAARKGVAVQVGAASGFGQWIVLQHDVDGRRVDTVYGHMWNASAVIKQGQVVEAGQHIAFVGANGQVTGPHLHFEVWEGGRYAGKAVDPVPYLSGEPTPGPVLRGEIATTYNALPQASKDHLGALLMDEAPAADGRGLYNHFAGGSIYWCPEYGAWVVWGGIRDAWAVSGWERGPLGFPVSDEFTYTGRRRDGSAVTFAQNNFEHGSIRWDPVDGAVVQV